MIEGSLWSKDGTDKAWEDALTVEEVPDALLSLADEWINLIEDPAKTDEWFASRFEFNTTDGEVKSGVVGKALSQVFNHGAHHRGQLTSAIFHWGARRSSDGYPSLDLQGLPNASGNFFSDYS
eukprot:TRINITY_DN24164_c1_g1_i3.p1 TRINITY_DN24164_c1_g1~~TRINITY_DN24164_c1_g1_i3.p1  ORF type:complete len:123 (+),score=21.56 TRINITY_DN24164_c1_g1_i3:190-558(+)